MNKLIIVVVALWFNLGWCKNTDIKKNHESIIGVKNYRSKAVNFNLTTRFLIKNKQQMETQQVIHGFEKQKEKFSIDTKGGIKTLNNSNIMP